MDAMLARTLSPDLLNTVLNNTDVHAWITQEGQGELDLTHVICNPENVCLVTEHGGFIFEKHEPCVYEVHTQFLQIAPSGHALSAALEARTYMFTKTDALEIYTKVPECNERARKLAVAAGFVHRFKAGSWKTKSGLSQIDHYVMRYEDWILADKSLQAAGEWFHSNLETAGAGPDHEKDTIHDRFVGAAVKACMGGQYRKAIVLYNRWARSCGYLPARIISESPLLIDINTCLLHVRENDFEVLKCQAAQ